MVGISTANPVQLDAIRNTVKDGGTTGSDTGTTSKRSTEPQTGPGKQLTPAEQREVSELQRIDTAVRAHEQAHINAGRDLVTSGPNYQYTYGPDGKAYAVAGEVGIDTSPEREPEANIDKGLHIQHTALAPLDPSSQDYSVAATGRQLEQQGRSDLREQQAQEAAATRDSRLQAYTGDTGTGGQVDVYA